MSGASFDRVAPYYDFLARAVFGHRLRRAQYCFLPQLPTDAHVLVVGGGTGWLLTALLQQSATVRVTYLEASAQMIRLTRQRIARECPSAAARVTYVRGTEAQLLATDTYSVVITNFLLDMYEGDALDRIIQTLNSHLEPNGYWLFTDFRLSHQRRRRWWQWLMARAMYAFFRVSAGIRRQSLPPYHRHFTDQGLRRTHERSFYGDFIVSRVYQKDATA